MRSTVPAPVASVPVEDTGFAPDWIRGHADRWLPRHPAREDDWSERIAELAGRAPAEAVWERAGREADRLGADDVSRDGVRRLAAGEALCVTTGQQPGLFLGPLYTVYKAMTAVALARRLASSHRCPVVPVFWNAADDSDFGEVGSSVLPGDGFSLNRQALSGGDLPAGGMVGDLGAEGTRRALEAVRAGIAGRPGGSPVIRHLEAALERASDHGDLTTALLYDLFRGTGLVVVDGRWPELRTAAAGLFRAWAERREAAAERILETGGAMREAGYRGPIKDGSLRNGLFAVEQGIRVPFEGTDEELLRRIDEAPETLSPNVTLRALVQDSLFPNVATVAGPSEIAYHAQLAGEYELLGVTMPVLFPRFAATLVPTGVRELAERRREPLESFVRDFDETMRRTADRALPEPAREALERLDHGVEQAFEPARQAAAGIDPKLDGAFREAARRARDAAAKARDKVIAALRAAETRRDPAVKSYREFLKPRGVPQERVLSALTLFLESEEHPLEGLSGALDAHLDAVRARTPLHWLIDFGGCREERE